MTVKFRHGGTSMEDWKPGQLPPNYAGVLFRMAGFFTLLVSLLWAGMYQRNLEEYRQERGRIRRLLSSISASSGPAVPACPDGSKPEVLRFDFVTRYICGGKNLLAYDDGHLHIIVEEGEVEGLSANWLGFSSYGKELCEQEPKVRPTQLVQFVGDYCVVHCNKLAGMECAHRLYVSRDSSLARRQQAEAEYLIASGQKPETQ